jgi:hypothetical protein
MGTNCVINRKIIISVAAVGQLSPNKHTQKIILSTAGVSVECQQAIFPGRGLCNNNGTNQEI